MKKQARLKQRRSFLSVFLLALLFWSLWGFVLFRIPPESDLLLTAFCSLLFLAVFLTFALVFANSKVGLATAAFVITALLFRYFGIGNLLNLLLLASIFTALAFYWKN